MFKFITSSASFVLAVTVSNKENWCHSELDMKLFRINYNMLISNGRLCNVHGGVQE